MCRISRPEPREGSRQCNYRTIQWAHTVTHKWGTNGPDGWERAIERRAAGVNKLQYTEKPHHHRHIWSTTGAPVTHTQGILHYH